MIRFVDETGSTNADMAALVRSDAPPADGDWLVARRQTAGRGRQGRDWYDGAGNFMGSTLVTIRKNDPAPASLSFVAALAVGQAIDHALGGACRPRLKWPNDVSLDGGKVAGILLEMVGDKVVVGIGINLVSAPQLPDRKTAKLSDYAAPPNLQDFADRVGQTFAQYLQTWRDEGLAAILRGFLFNTNHQPGAPISVHDLDGSKVEGTFESLEQADGALRLRLADGSVRVIRTGELAEE